MGRRRVFLLAIAVAIATAAAAPAAHAITAKFGTGFTPDSAYLYILTEPGESNDLRVVASGGPFASVVTITDRKGTFEALPPVPPGSCDDYGCEVPCRIITPHRARCDIADGFTMKPGDRALGTHTFNMASIDLGPGGPDRLVIPAISIPFSYGVSSGGSSRFRFGGPSYVFLSTGAGDRVNYLNGSRGRIQIYEPNVTVRTINGMQNWIMCGAGTEPKVRIDPTDWVSAACGDDVLPPRLPTGGVIPIL